MKGKTKELMNEKELKDFKLTGEENYTTTEYDIDST